MKIQLLTLGLLAAGPCLLTQDAGLHIGIPLRDTVHISIPCVLPELSKERPTTDFDSIYTLDTHNACFIKRCPTDSYTIYDNRGGDDEWMKALANYKNTLVKLDINTTDIQAINKHHEALRAKAANATTLSNLEYELLQTNYALRETCYGLDWGESLHVANLTSEQLQACFANGTHGRKPPGIHNAMICLPRKLAHAIREKALKGPYPYLDFSKLPATSIQRLFEKQGSKWCTESTISILLDDLSRFFKAFAGIANRSGAMTNAEKAAVKAWVAAKLWEAGQAPSGSSETTQARK